MWLDHGDNRAGVGQSMWLELERAGVDISSPESCDGNVLPHWERLSRAWGVKIEDEFGVGLATEMSRKRRVR